jgi:hypothetical protein
LHGLHAFVFINLRACTAPKFSQFACKGWDLKRNKIVPLHNATLHRNITPPTLPCSRTHLLQNNHLTYPLQYGIMGLSLGDRPANPRIDSLSIRQGAGRQGGLAYECGDKAAAGRCGRCQRMLTIPALPLAHETAPGHLLKRPRQRSQGRRTYLQHEPTTVQRSRARTGTPGTSN